MTAQPVDWTRLAQDYQRHMNDLVHREAESRYGDDFYAEALRRTFGYRPASDGGHYDTLHPLCGLTTTAGAAYLLETHTIIDKGNVERARKELAEARVEHRRAIAEMRRDLAKWLRDVIHDRTVPSKYRREGALQVVDWIDPDVKASPYRCSGTDTR